MKSLHVILEELCGLIARYTKLSRDQINPNIPFLEMGADSMILVRAIREIEKMYAVKITIRTLYEKLNNLNQLAAYIAGHTGKESNDHFQGNKQIAAEKSLGSGTVITPPAPPVLDKEEIKSKPEKKASWQTAKPETALREYSLQQQQALDALLRRFNRKSPKSKNLTQKYRNVLADSKATVGFRMSIKEMLYPIVGARTEGSKLWDIDGNEYVDITMGFGTHLFGYKPEFVMDAMKEYVLNGIQLGPRSQLTGQVAEMIRELTGMERVAFANTGTEANMAVLRLVRAATGKSRIAMFKNSYHGHSDYTLAEGQFRLEDGTLLSVTPGIPQSVLPEVLILEYGNYEALQKIAEHQDELAGVIVEPVQSRDPLLQPGEFLRVLRELTLQLDIPLIFDEMITGFRCHPGGAQALFGIKADIATYGKAIGGGLPIGVIAGKAKYLDGIDGGFWSYGDPSFPQTERTFFGGTFCQHPMVISVAHAVLKHLKEQGEALQENLNAKTEKFAKRLNQYFAENKVPVKISHFASVFRFEFESAGNLDLFYYYMIERGVYIWEWRLCFLTTAHTDADIEFIIQAAKESAEDLRRGGFLPPDTPVPRDLVYHPLEETKELTKEQKQLWVLAQLGENESGSNAYNVIANLQIEGNFNYTVLKNAIQKVTDRYEVLRSTIKPEKIVQKIYPAYKIELPVIDFTPYDPKQQKSIVDNWITAFNKQPFDLVKKPAFQAVILKLSSQVNILVVKAHHIFVDGITLGILLEEIAELYSAGCEIRTPQLPEPVNSFPYNEEYEQERTLNLTYWINRLRGPLPVCSLPYDFPRPNSRIHRGSNRQITIKAPVYSRLAALALENHSTLYMVLLSLFSSFLYRICRAEDIIVIAPTSGRYTRETERVMGHYAGVLPVRISIDGNDSFLAHLKKTAAVIMENFEYQNFSFHDLCESLKSQENEWQSISRFPITPIFFNLDKLPQQISFSDASVSLYLAKTVSYVDHDLFINFIEGNDKLILDCQYSMEVFRAETVERMINAFLVYLENAIHEQKQPIREIEILTGQEMSQIKNEFNATEMSFSSAVYHEMFREQAQKTPDHIALVFGERGGSRNSDAGSRREYTYKQLDEISDRLAYDLRQQGITRDSIVPVMVERSEDIVIGALAVMKAGGAYVAVDPEYPEERIKFILEDCGAKVVLTNTVAKAAAIYGNVMDVRPYRRIPAGGQEERQKNSVCNMNQITDLCYVTYTSGSTGKPKGVMVEHCGLGNLCRWEISRYAVNEHSTGGVFVSYCFDASVLQLFMHFLCGGKVVLFPEAAAQSIAVAHEYIVDNRITHIDFPTQFGQLYLKEYGCGDLQAIWIGGEKLSGLPVPDKNNCRIINAYGPTESTVDAAEYEIVDFSDPVPIGTPLANTKIYIMNESNKLCPVGIPGELCISGVQLARGYLNQPLLTAEKFVKNPYYEEIVNGLKEKQEKGELDEDFIKACQNGFKRMYRTGDMARWLPDGNIEFLGRMDNQVKIRGYRIEPEEIEVQMARLEGITQSVVIARKDHNGREYLAGYYTRDCNMSISPGQIREELLLYLPEYMIPQYFLELDAFPMNASGKIDRTALPEPIYHCEEYAAPQTETEKFLAEIWCEILGLTDDPISINDNFFAMSGDSLTAIALAGKIQSKFGKRATLQDILLHATLERQASWIDAGEKDTKRIPRAEEKEHYPANAAQSRMYLVNKLEGNDTAYNIPVVIRVKGRLDKRKLYDTLDKIVTKHEAFRTCFGMEDEVVIQRIRESLEVVIEEKEINEEDLDREINEYSKPFDLDNGPLFRIMVFTVNQQNHIILFDVHHSIFDGRSMKLFMEDFAEGYRGKPIDGLKVRNRDYAEWENRQRDSEAYKKSERYWKKELAGRLEPLRLPVDKAAGKEQHEGRSIRKEIGKDLFERIRAMAQRDKTTRFNIFLAAYGILLAKYSRQEDVVVGIPSLGRVHPDIEKNIGMYVGSLPIRIRPASEKTVRQYIETITQTVVNGISNQEYPLEEILKWKRREQNGLENLFDVMFALAEGYEEQIKVDEIQLSGYEGKNRTAKFQLTGYVLESEYNAEITYEYMTGLFADETIQRLAGHYERVLEQITQYPEKKIKEIELAGKEEKELLVYDFNATEKYYGNGNQVYHKLFREQARRTPDHIAVVFGNKEAGEERTGRPRQYTYRQLDEITDILACDLRQRGVTRDSVVPVMMTRSADIVIGALGIIKAGGAFLPVDPKYPAERIHYMLADSRSKVILTNTDSEKIKLPAENKIEILDLSRYDPYTSEQLAAAAGQPFNSSHSGDLMVCLYTSGTTGKPKGIMLTHQNMLNISWNENSSSQITASDHVAAHANIVFDGFWLSVFPPLLAGAAVYIMEEEIRLSLPAIHEYLLKNDITITFMTTQLCEAYAREYENRTLRILLTGGEALTKSYNRSYKIINGYGPAESCVYVTRFEVDAEYRNIPIGKPLPNIKIYVLDNNDALCPVGVPGELCISGMQLARGYLNCPELTAEKFVANPYYGEVEKSISEKVKKGQLPANYLAVYLSSYRKMYRSGDLAKWLPDGNLQFIGRSDKQVKIRGYRIELEEIEAQLSRIKGIKQCVVTVKQGRDARDCLAGYYVLDRHDMPDQDPAAFVREQLLLALPEYMVPQYLNEVADLPATASGKLDRQGLPELNCRRKEYIPPQTETEKALAGIWGETVGIGSDQISVTDHFFDIGGNSLSLISLSGKIAKRFQKMLDAKTLLENSRLGSMAKKIECSRQTSYLPVIKINEQAVTVPLIFIHDGDGGAESYLTTLAKKMDPAIPVYFIDNYFRQTIGMERFKKEVTIEQAAQKYLEFIKAEIPNGPYRLGGWSFGGMVALEIAQRLAAQGEKVEELFIIDPVAVEKSGNLRLYEQWPKPVYKGKTIFFRCEKPPEETGIQAGGDQWLEMGRQYPLNGYEDILPYAERILLNCSHYEVLGGDHLLKIIRKISSEFTG